MLSEPTKQQAVRLLSPSEEAHWLPSVGEEVKALAIAMTDPDMEQRPLINDVLSHSWFSKQRRR